MAFEVFNKTVAYAREQETVDPIFASLDADKSGALDAQELLPLLQMIAARADIAKEAVTQEDAEFVMGLADKDKSGAIEKDEVLMAAATWKHLLAGNKAPLQLKGKRDQQKKSSACTLL